MSDQPGGEPGRRIEVLTDHHGVVVVNKPAGLPTAGRDLGDPRCVQWRLTQQLGRRRVWAVHQLDRGTTGLNLFVTRKALVSEWSERLRADGTRKRYLALCHGSWEGPTERIVTLAIGRRAVRGRSLPAITKSGKPARSDVRLLSTHGQFCAVSIIARTGRTHQVRLHLASLGHPVIGEPLHRDPPCQVHDRPALHAWSIDLTGGPDELRRLRAPIPSDLIELADNLGLSLPSG